MYEQGGWGPENQLTDEGEIYTFTPQEIVPGYLYFADVYVDSGGEVVSDKLANEGEVNDDGWFWRLVAEPDGVTLDWFKLYLSTYWKKQGISVYGDPELDHELLEVIEFPGGAYIVSESPNRVTIQTRPVINSSETLGLYIAYRTKALIEYLHEVRGGTSVAVVVTFAEPLKPEEYVKLVRSYDIAVKSYGFVGEKGIGGVVVRDPDEPYDQEFEKAIRSRGDAIKGVTSFKGSVSVDALRELRSDARILLIDLVEDLTVQKLVEKYSGLGKEIIIKPPCDIWVEHGLYA